MKTAALATFIAVASVDASAQTITVTRETCANLVQYVPSADVEYRPGTDVVNGEKVVPADLNGGSKVKIPEDFTIAITVEIAHVLGIPASPDPAHPELDLYKPEANIGTVTYRDGRAYFNGQPLENDAEAELAALCQRIRPR